MPTTSTSPSAAATAQQVGLPAGTPIVAGAGDGPLGNLGIGALTPGVAGLTLGTSGAVRVVADRPRIDVGRMLFCCALTDSVWVLGGAISNGGAVIRWADEALTPDLEAVAGQPGSDEAVLDFAAKVAAGCDGLVLLPYLFPERAPLWDPDLAGAVLGLHREHTRAHFVLAAVEGVCMQMRIIVDAVDEVEPVSVVHATGGCFRSSLWRDVMAATIGRPLHVVDGAGGTALGAAALGLFALGRAVTLTDAARQLGVGTTRQCPVAVDPASTATYDRLRASVPELIDQLGRVASQFSSGYERTDDEYE